MPGWTLVDTHPTQGRTFKRPLDVTELSFLWDGLFNGTADNVQHLEIRLPNGSQDAHLFSDANIVRAWVSTKRRYPLVGATVEDINPSFHLRLANDSKTDGGARDTTESFPFRLTKGSKAGGGAGVTGTGFASDPHFVVREHDLAILRPGEIVFGEVASAEEAQHRAAAILDGPRPLSEKLLVQLYVFREGDSKRTHVLHLMTLMAHCVSDGAANYTFTRCFLDTLARGGRSDSEPPQIPLEDRLAMAIPAVDVEPLHLRSLSPAKRRWRRAVGMVIFQLMMARRQGGHTLPCRLTRSTPHIAAKSCLVSTWLTHEQSAAVIANCRLHNITFGHAYLTLAQVAMTRVLYRRYLHGEISEEEWAYRKKQPHISGGPLNMRPYLDKTWFDRGGGGEFMMCIGFFFFQLPFMTLGVTAERHQQYKRDPARFLSNGAPPFSDLLTFDRFLHRAGMVKKQAAAFYGHPLFYEIVRVVSLMRLERTRLGALQWMRHANGNDTKGDTEDDEALAMTDIPMIWAHGGSSIGNVDSMSPVEYPLPSTHPLSPYSSVSHPANAGYVIPPSSLPPAPGVDVTPKIAVEYTKVHLHTRPAELYLGAASARGRLSMYAFYDGNVFEEEVVREWVDEVKEAVLWYLGRTHRSRQSDGDVQAKL